MFPNQKAPIHVAGEERTEPRFRIRPLLKALTSRPLVLKHVHLSKIKNLQEIHEPVLHSTP